MNSEGGHRWESKNKSGLKKNIPTGFNVGMWLNIEAIQFVRCRGEMTPRLGHSLEAAPAGQTALEQPTIRFTAVSGCTPRRCTRVSDSQMTRLLAVRTKEGRSEQAEGLDGRTD